MILTTLKRALKSVLTLGVGLLIYAMLVDDARAAITYQTTGAVGYSNATSIAPPYPASVAAGDLLILIIGMKPSAANSGSVAAPEGWTLITSLVGAGGYGVTLGADTGNTNVFAYYKLAEGNETGSVLVRLTNNNSAWAQMYRLTNATQNWSVAGTTGSDATGDAAVSITMAANPAVAAGDFILGAMVIPTDVQTPTQFSAEAFTQTGVAFGAVTEISEPDSTTGNDIGGFVVRSSVTAGTGTAAPVMTATAGGTTTNVRGPGIFIRVRATGAITYQPPGALNYVANLASVCPVHPASVAVGNLLVTLIGMKPSAANSGSVTTPSGWTAVSGGSLTGAGGYGATLGADTGNTNVFSFFRVARGNEATERCFALTTNNVSWAQMNRFSSTTQTWSVAGTTGPDITAGSVSITMSANPGVTVGDHILGAMVIPTDVQTPTQFSAEAFAQTGVTFGAVTEVSEPDTTTGNDLGGFVVRSTATSGVGSAAPVMSATAGGTTTNVRGPGVLIRIRDESAFSQAAFRFYDDGTEAGSTAIAAQDTNISRNLASGNRNHQLRLRVQETNAASGAATDDYQLQYSKNGGAYTNVTGASANVRGFNSASLSDGVATTNRLGAGTGSFVAGVIAEDGLADNHQITASNYTEYLFSLTLVSADLASTDTLDFRILRNGATIAAYSVTPRITITKVTVGSFNAFETSTVANATTGKIFTKLAGVGPFGLDVVAISGGTQVATFSDNVNVELLSNTGTPGAGYGVVDNCPTSNTVLLGPTTTTIAGGRSTVNFAAVAGASPDVRVRISYPTVSPTVTTCSTDSFAIRPTSFTSVVGGAPLNMNNVATSGTPSAIAGSGTFTVIAATGIVGYTGTPKIDNSAVQAHANAIQAGTVSGTFPAALTATGTSTGTSVFTYSEVGNFRFRGYDPTSDATSARGVYDDTFTAVDVASDCTDDFSNTLASGKYGCKFGITANSGYFGRFYPKDFLLTTGTLTNRRAASCAPASTFAYAGEQFRVTFSLTARNGAGTPAITKNYDPTAGFARFNAAIIANLGFGAIDLADTTPPLTATALTGNLTLGTSSGTWASGDVSVTADMMLTRAAAPEDGGPFESFRLGIDPVDADGVKLSSYDLDTSVPADTSDRGLVGSSKIRFGRLRLLNAYGSELLPLRVPIRAEYFNGTAWTLNAADNCTSLAANAFGLSGGIAANTSASAVAPLIDGKGTLTLAKPSPVATGTVDVAINLGSSGSDQSCLSSHGGTAANMSWLRGSWAAVANCNGTAAWAQDPNARVKFGASKAPYIYLRERY